MLRPERMSRVSITGTKRVLDTVIETVHGLGLVHMSDYNGVWEGFEPGDPLLGADEAAESLVTVRSLQSILDIDPERRRSASPGEGVEREEMEDRLERVREDANRLDDRRDELRDEHAALGERTDATAPLETLGIDLDLLSGYDSLETRVGEGDESEIRAALDAAEGVERYETFTEGSAVAVFARPVSGHQNVLEDALVGAEFTAIEVPDAEGSPESYRQDLQDQRAEIDSRIEEIDSDLADLREGHAEFLVAAEDVLAVEVQQREAPLSFATTKNAFVAEGWIPTARFSALQTALSESAGEHVAVEELERASYDGDGRVVDREPTDSTGSDAAEATEGDVSDSETATDGGVSGEVGDDDEGSDGSERHEDVRADGGSDAPMAEQGPPVVQQNPGPVRPFEMLVRTVSRPQYSEIDPSIVLFLTLPLMYGFMIADVGYGVIYAVGGYLLYRRFESNAISSIGAIGVWGGGFTILFGLLHGEIFGYRTIAHAFWEGTMGLEHAPIEKGLMPATTEYAEAWLVISVLFGVVHMAVGYVFDFVDNLRHGFRVAMLEAGSWLVLMVGVWIWALSHALEGPKPELLFSVFDGEPFALGFAGFTPIVGWVALVIALVVGLGLATYNEVSHFGGVGLIVGPLEGLRAAVVNPLSYTRLAAEVLAEVGLAFAVNLLFFGAYQSNDRFHFLIGHGPGYVDTLGSGASVMFDGLIHFGVLGVLLGVVVLVAGHLLVLGIGVMSAGLQAVRLEYVEFFNQFYEGGGDEYRPFGYEPRRATEE